MYIVKLIIKGTVLSKESVTYIEAETEEEALEKYEEIVNQYPYLIEGEIFKTEKVDISDSILEEAKRAKEEENKIKMFMLENGVSDYEVMRFTNKDKTKLISKGYSI